MRKIIILSLFLASCANDNEVTISNEEYDRLRGVKKVVPESPKKIDNEEFSIIKVDECEYLAYNIGFNKGILTHKGNCKFCQKRIENIIREKIQEELKKQK
jgi:predicted secreted protein